jgi:hypothetical protein
MASIALKRPERNRCRSTTRHGVVLNAQTIFCPHCHEARLKARTQQAGLTFLRRDPEERGYAFVLAPCGHTIRRQFSLLDSVGNGSSGIRCEVCHAAREAEEAQTRSWELLGPDPTGVRGYRLYRHGEGCGHVQRIARANMQSGRFNCEACGEGWSSAPSAIYVMQFQVPDLGNLTKIGFSRDPMSRLQYQLRPAPGVAASIVRTLAMPSGRTALNAERGLHRAIRRRFPDAALPRHQLQDWIRVGSEIYRDVINDFIHERLDQLQRRTVA